MTSQIEDKDETSNDSVNPGINKCLKYSTGLGVTALALSVLFTPPEIDRIWLSLMGMMAACVGLYLIWFPEGRLRQGHAPLRYVIWGVSAFILNAVATIRIGQLGKRLIDHLEGR